MDYVTGWSLPELIPPLDFALFGRPIAFPPNIRLGVKVPYFIEYSVHFFILKMMLKYSLHTVHGR